MKKIVGVRHVQGTYEGNSYDNFILYVTESASDPNVIGICPQAIKVKSKVFYDHVSPEKIKNVINRELEIYYDAYKNVCKLDFKDA